MSGLDGTDGRTDGRTDGYPIQLWHQEHRPRAMLINRDFIKGGRGVTILWSDFTKKSLFFRIDGFPNPEYKEDSGMTLLTSRLCVLSSSPELANFDSLICWLQIDLSGLEYKLKKKHYLLLSLVLIHLRGSFPQNCALAFPADAPGRRLPENKWLPRCWDQTLLKYLDETATNIIQLIFTDRQQGKLVKYVKLVNWWHNICSGSDHP